MKNIYSLFFILVFFLILIKELLPVFIISALIGVLAFIVTTIIKEKRAKKLEIINKEREKIRQEHKKRKEERQHKIQNIHEKCKRFGGLLNNEGLAKQEKTLKSILSVTPRSVYDKPFLDVNIQRNQAKYDIFKYALSCIDSIRNNTFTDDMMLELDRLIVEYDKYKFCNDGFYISVVRKAEYEKLKGLVEDVRNKCFTMLTPTSYSSTLNLCSGQRKTYNFRHEYFLDVRSSEKIIRLSCQNVSLYIYPLFIVEAMNNENFIIHPWRELSFDIRKIRAYTKGYGSELKGAVELCHSYEHTCIDGSPDMRYKKNDIYRTYNVYIVTCKQIPSFNIIVANGTLANSLLQHLNQYVILEETQRSIDVRNKGNDDDTTYSFFLNGLDNTISKYGVEIIPTKRLFFILSDIGSFKNDSKLRLLFRDLADDNILDIFLNSYVTQAKIEDLALIYSYKFNFPVDDCVSIINKIKDVIGKYRVR